MTLKEVMQAFPERNFDPRCKFKQFERVKFAFDGFPYNGHKGVVVDHKSGRGYAVLWNEDPKCVHFHSSMELKSISNGLEEAIKQKFKQEIREEASDGHISKEILNEYGF